MAADAAIVLGVQKIIDATLHWPATVVYTVIAIVFCVIWVWIGTVIERAIDEGVPPKLGNNSLIWGEGYP